MAEVPKISSEPLYRQVRDLFAERIARGVWRPSTMLPNEHDLAREIGVSPGTVRKALEVLEKERLLRRQQGRGTFVADHDSDELATRFSNIRDENGRRIAGSLQLLSQTAGPATRIEQQHLQLESAERVVRTSRRRHDTTGVFMYEEACLAATRFPGLEDTHAGNYRLSSLAQQHGIYLGRAYEDVNMEQASVQVAEVLQCDPHTPLLKLDRTVFTIEGEIIEWRVARCLLRGGNVYVAEIA